MSSKDSWVQKIQLFQILCSGNSREKESAVENKLLLEIMKIVVYSHAKKQYKHKHSTKWLDTNPVSTQIK